MSAERNSQCKGFVVIVSILSSQCSSSVVRVSILNSQCTSSVVQRINHELSVYKLRGSAYQSWILNVRLCGWVYKSWTLNVQAPWFSVSMLNSQSTSSVVQPINLELPKYKLRGSASIPCLYSLYWFWSCEAWVSCKVCPIYDVNIWLLIAETTESPLTEIMRDYIMSPFCFTMST